MNLTESLLRWINVPLRRFGHEVRPVRKTRTPFSMGDALGRARLRGCNVKTVIDVGASDGAWSRLAMPHFPGAKYLLFEPLEERRAALEAFKQAHPEADFVCAAVGDHHGEANFLVSPDLDGSGISETGGGVRRTVPLTTIDAEVAKAGLEGPFLIKLDTHGFEVSILRGAAKCLRQAELLVIEVYNFKICGAALRFHEFCAHAEELGFRCCDLADPLLRSHDQALWQMDLFFVPKDSSIFRHQGFQ